MARLILLLLSSLFIFAACRGQQLVVVTATPSPLPTDEPTTTPTREVAWINDAIYSCLNENCTFLYECTNIKVGEAGRELCVPAGWSTNVSLFSDESPPPEMVSVLGNLPDGADSYIQLRADWLNDSTFCLIGNDIALSSDRNYVLKLEVELVTPNYNAVNTSVASILVATTNGQVYNSRPEVLSEGMNELFWVFSPRVDTSLHYEFCLSFNGNRDLDLNIYNAAVYEASGFWGEDVAIPLM